jgi:hypothetical protein
MNIRRVAVLLVLSGVEVLFAQSPVTFRYFYDDSAELFRVLDSTGILIEYIYDPSGNITQTNRSTVAPGSLSILNVTPLSGGAGSTITVYGQNFSNMAANNIVKINGIAATVVSASATQLVIQVPAGVTAGQLTVTVNGVTVNSGPTLVFTPYVHVLPVINSITPDGALAGTTLTVAVIGANLAGAVLTFPAGVTVLAENVAPGGTSATLQLAALSTRGAFPLVATTTAGSSTSAVTPGNRFIVMISPDEADSRLISVLNEVLPANGALDPTNVSNQADSQVASVLNESLPANGALDPTNVSNEADSAVASLLNNFGSSMMSGAQAGARRRQIVSFASGYAAAGAIEVAQPGAAGAFVGGQTAVIGVRA